MCIQGNPKLREGHGQLETEIDVRRLGAAESMIPTLHICNEQRQWGVRHGLQLDVFPGMFYCHCDWQIYVYIVWFFTSSALWSLVTFSTEFPRVFRRHWQSACTAPGNIKLMPAVSDVQGDCEDVYGHRMLGIQAWALTSKVSVHSKHCSNWVW